MRPLVPVIAAFIAGIITSDYAVITPGLFLFLLPASFIPLLFLFLTKKKAHPASIIPPFFVLGALSIIPYVRTELPPTHIRNHIHTTEEVLGNAGIPVEGRVLNIEGAGKRTRLLIDSNRLYDGKDWKAVTGKVLLTVQGPADGIERNDIVKFVAPLRKPWNFGNPGEFDYKRWLALQGIYVAGFLKNDLLLVKTGEGKKDFLSRVDGIRNKIRSLIDSASLRNAEVLKALIIAEQRGIGKDVKEAFSKTGTAHILSISGLHVGIVALFSYSVILFFLKRSERLMLAVNVKRAATVLTIAPIFGYGLLAGFPVPTQRAVIMAIAFIASFALNRGKDLFNTIALSALIILLIAPYAVWDVSFQLTYAAMASIIYLVPKLKAIFGLEKYELKKDASRFAVLLHAKVIPAVLVTLAAGLGTSPIIAYHFHFVSLAGLFANIVAVPLTGVIVPLLLVSAVASPVSDLLASVPLYLADIIFEAVLFAVKAFAFIPYSSVWAGTPSLVEVFSVYGIVFSVVDFKKGRYYIAASAAFFAVLLASHAYPAFYHKGDMLKATFISVGQGDSSLIQFPDGKTMLIDGGGFQSEEFDAGERVIAPFLAQVDVKKIDYMVLTHTQLDHMGGLKFIADNFRVGEFWWNGDGVLGALQKALERNRIPVKTVVAGDSFSIDGGLVEVLHPSRQTGLDKNNMSLVLRVTYKEKAFLFTGDIAADAEGELAGADIKADVLKVPHHGSKYSSSEGFLRRVAPSLAVISAGRHNAFGFPNEETLARLDRVKAKVLRTDTAGAVTVETDGRSLKAYTHLTGDKR